jgi:hypothetical protein
MRHPQNIYASSFNNFRKPIWLNLGHNSADPRWTQYNVEKDAWKAKEDAESLTAEVY